MNNQKEAPRDALKDIETLENRPAQDPQQIRSMFDRISGGYDRLNHILTLGIDKVWRTKAVAELGDLQQRRCLDLCCGTGDMTLEMFRQSEGEISEIVGLDFSQKMLDLAAIKLEPLTAGAKITLLQGDATKLPFEGSSFDLATTAFGIRNVQNVPRALAEVMRTLKSGGRFVILEFSMPDSAIIRALYRLYFRYVLPTVGGALSGDKSAYTYLNRSAEAFPQGDKFAEILSQAGFTFVTWKKLSLGLVTIYTAQTP